MQPTPRPPFFFPIQLVSGYFSSLGTVRFLPSGPMATYVKYASDVSMRSFVPPAPSGSISAVMRIFIEVFPTLSRSAVSTTTSFGIAGFIKERWSTLTVTTSQPQCLFAQIAPAISIQDMIWPPNSRPDPFVEDKRTISDITVWESAAFLLFIVRYPPMKFWLL